MKPFKQYSEGELIAISKELKRIETEIFNKQGLQMFLVFGTLLGAIRDKTYIKNDNDIDVAVYFGKHNNNFAIKLIKTFNNYLDINNLWVGKKSLGQFKIKTFFGCIDCWSCWTDTNNKIHLGYAWHGISGHNHFFPMKRINLYEYEFNVPKCSELLLSQWYDNWKVPCVTKGYEKSKKNHKSYEQYLKELNK